MGRPKKEENPQTNLDQKLTELEKQFGLQKASENKEYETVRTGLYALDYVLDQIKIVEGGMKIEFYGKESSGKTTFAKKVVAKFQELDKVCVWIVSESFHKEWAEKMGIDTNKLLLYYPESVEDGGEKILDLVGKVDLIVLDSVASLISEAELKGTLSDKTRATQAKAYSEFTRKLYKKIAHYKTALLFINQIRIDMNKTYGNPEDTPCGKALKHMYDCLGPKTIIYNGENFIPLKYLKDKTLSYDFKHKKYRNNKILRKNTKKFIDYLELDLGITKIEMSNNHKLYVMSSDGELKLKKAKDLNKTDMLLLAKGKKFKIKNPSFTNSNFARMLGYFIGDGYKIKKENHIIIADKNRNNLEYYQNLLMKENFLINKYSSCNSYLLHIIPKFSNHLFKTIKRYKLDKKAPKKEIPFLFYNFSEKCLKQFIAGFYDAEGNDNTNLPIFHSSSKRLLESIQFMLWRLGIKSTINGKKYQSLIKITNDNKYYNIYHLCVSDSDSIKRFKKVIPTLKNIKSPKFNGKIQYYFVNLIKEYHDILSKNKQITKYLGRDNSLRKLIKQKTISIELLKKLYNNTKNVTSLKNQHKKSLLILELNKNFDFLKIKKIIKKKSNIKWWGFRKKLIDIQVKNDENFIANGILSHNSRIEFKTGQPIDIGQGDKKERIGIELKLHGYKNKLGVAKRSAVVDFYFEDGKIDNHKSLLYAGIKTGVIEFSGKTYTFGDKKAVGKDAFINTLTEKDWKKIEENIWKKVK